MFFINHRYDGVQLWDLRLVLSCPSPALWPDADGALVQSDCTAAVAADVLLSQAPGIHQVCWILSFISFWFPAIYFLIAEKKYNAPPNRYSHNMAWVLIVLGVFNFGIGISTGVLNIIN